ncbi:hypothetical protein PVW53_06640 [Seohaeicola sp. SP36]|uniref:hypothetical protein n=1 Tax=unclassified Seohaeicola TaxID=2641111 RepID=UPI00237A39F1|nr:MULTISPECIES: hypothetical protein [unclassified Seohaeicola]MDD9706956.1 hypothetical protein [Seohaeicola sp. 4SK31]MDD9735192.1 hypothetical protein [Seohaeicola sp. SP36]
MADNIRILGVPDPGVTDETNWGNANHYALPPEERRKSAQRKNEQAARWARAEAVRANWTPEDFTAEEERLQAEVAAKLAERKYRDAA